MVTRQIIQRRSRGGFGSATQRSLPRIETEGVPSRYHHRRSCANFITNRWLLKCKQGAGLQQMQHGWWIWRVCYRLQWTVSTTSLSASMRPCVGLICWWNLQPPDLVRLGLQSCFMWLSVSRNECEPTHGPLACSLALIQEFLLLSLFYFFYFFVFFLLGLLSYSLSYCCPVGCCFGFSYQIVGSCAWWAIMLHKSVFLLWTAKYVKQLWVNFSFLKELKLFYFYW